jgi:hypothetical protein
MKLLDAIKMMVFSLSVNAVGWGIVIADDAQGRWMLMSRHGECVEINSLKGKLPNLPNISEVSSLIEFANSRGHFVNSKELRGSAGRAYEIEISDLSLNLVLVRESLCAKR